MSAEDEFLEAFSLSVKRPGADRLLAWLKKTDFFTAPASTRFHGDHEGGLAEHSLNVYRRLQEEVKALPVTPSDETVAVCGLLHDICKANFYKVSQRNVKNAKTGRWEKQPFYQVEDQFPYGHGEKSVFLIERFMRLKVEEAVAIRWHMGGFDDAAKGGSYAVSGAFEKYPLLLCLNVADMKATYLDERKEEKDGTNH
jgi:hypothetical protein